MIKNIQFFAFFLAALMSFPAYAGPGDINFNPADLTSAVDDLPAGIDASVKDFLRDKTPDEVAALMNLQELNVLNVSNDMLNGEIRGLLGNISLAGDFTQALDDLRIDLDFDVDVSGEILNLVSADIMSLVSDIGDFSSLQTVFGEAPNIQEIIASVSAFSQLEGDLAGLSGILDDGILDQLTDMPFLKGNVNALIDRFGLSIPNFGMTLPGDINFNMPQIQDLINGLPLNLDVREFLLDLDVSDIANLINLDDMNILPDMADFFNGDLSEIIGNVGELGQLTSALGDIKTQLGFIPNNFAENLLSNMDVFDDMTDIMQLGEQFESLQNVLGAVPSPQQLVGIMNMTQQTGGSLVGGASGLLSGSTQAGVESIDNFEGNLSAATEETTGEAIPEVEPEVPEDEEETTDPVSATETGLCGGMDDFKRALGFAEGGGNYCIVGGGGGNYVGKYQFNQATLGDESRVPSSCYSGCRQLKNECFRCNGPAQEQAFSCYFEQNKKIIDGDIKKESGGRYNSLDEYLADPDNPYLTNEGGKRCLKQKSEYYYAGCKGRLASGAASKKAGPSCMEVTKSGVYGAGHLIGPYLIGDMLVEGHHADDGFCTSAFHYGEKFKGIDIDNTAADGSGEACPAPVDIPNEPLPGGVEPGDEPEDYEPEEVVPGTAGYGSGDDDKGIKTNFNEGGTRNFEASTFSAPSEGGTVTVGTKEADDRSAADLLQGAGDYKTEDDFDFSETMAWIEDFEQHGMAPVFTDVPAEIAMTYSSRKRTCWYFYIRWTWRGPRTVLALLPACSVKVNYSEPTAMVEVVGEPGLSYVGDLSDLVAETEHSDGGVGMGLGMSGISFNEAHVFGISPEARVDSSGSEETKRRAFTCDLAVSGVETWPNMTLPGLPLTPNIDADAGPPDLMRTMNLSGIELLLTPTYRLKWFMGAEDKGKDVELPLLFASEEHRPDWVEMQGSLGEVTADSVPCDQNGRINSDSMTSPGLPNRYADGRGCVGSWGLLEPMTGFATNGQDIADKAIVAARAYSIAKQNSIYPMITPAPTEGTLIPKIEYAHIGWKYWYTDFNVEWPYEGKQRFMLGEDTFKWDSVLQANNYKSRGLAQWLAMDKSTGYGGESATKDGLVMTMWKKTTCRIYVCCHRWSYHTRWRHISDHWLYAVYRLNPLIGPEKAWEIKSVTEIDDWDTDKSREFNPGRM
jgi:hypothetical protein